MKVVLITPYYTLSMQRKVTCMAMAGMQIHQVIPQTNHNQLNPILLKNQPVPNHQFVPVKLFHQFDPHRALLRSTLSWMKRFNPDLIAVEWDPDTLMALQVALARNLFAPCAKLLLHSWQNVTRSLKAHVRLILNYTLRQADGICCTNRAGELLLRNWGYKGQIFYQPWLGVDTSIFYPRQTEPLRQSLRLNGFIIGYVGRLSSEKGLVDLIQALEKLPDGIECLLIGSGPEEAQLKQLAVAQKVEKRIHFLGSVDNETIADYISLLNALVLPSRTTPVWKEQYGRVLLEAMACKVPIVGSDCGAIPEVVGKAGLIFPEGDVDALARHIQMLCENPDLGRQLGQEGYNRVITMYSQEQIAARMLQVYQQVIEC